jgi:hypothetical protein
MPFIDLGQLEAKEIVPGYRAVFLLTVFIIMGWMKLQFIYLCLAK